MPSIQCEKCRSTYPESKGMEYCPHCGVKIVNYTRLWVAAGIVAVLVILAVNSEKRIEIGGSVAQTGASQLPQAQSQIQTPKPLQASDLDEFQSAVAICKALENSGVTECFTEGGIVKSINAVIDTNSTEAKKICEGIVSLSRENFPSIRGKDWQVRIVSPYSGNNAIAKCSIG